MVAKETTAQPVATIFPAQAAKMLKLSVPTLMPLYLRIAALDRGRMHCSIIESPVFRERVARVVAGQEKTAQKMAQRMAEKKRLKAEQRARRRRLTPEQRAEEDRVLAEQKAEKKRLKAERKAEEERLRAAQRAEEKRQHQESVAAARARHEGYLAAIEQAAPTPAMRELLTTSYYIWLLNQRVKIIGDRHYRWEVYALKDRALMTVWTQYAPRSTWLAPDRGDDIARIVGLVGGDVPGGLCLPLHATGLDEATRPQAAIFLERVGAQGWEYVYDDEWGDRWSTPVLRHYLSIVVVYAGFRFPFHTQWENAEKWLPAPLRAVLPERAGAECPQPFTFGGRVATAAEWEAIPLDYIEDVLGGAIARARRRDARLLTHPR